MSYSIVRYRSEHRLAVARLLRPLWSADEKTNAEYVEWKYERNPFAGEPRLWLALDGDEVVGVRGLSGARWTNGATGDSVGLWHADDLLVAESHRKSGLARAITVAMTEDSDRAGLGLRIALTPSPVTTLVSLAAGWKILGAKRPMRIVQPAVAARRALRRRLIRLPVAWRLASRARLLGSRGEREPFAALDRARTRGTAGGPIVSDEPRPAEMAALVARASRDRRLHHVRDAVYFAWRFASPLARYRFLFAPGAQGLDGYLVLEHRNSSHDLGTVTIADWEAPDPRVRESLLGAALDRGRFGEIVTWSVTLAPETRGMLARAGFELYDGGDGLDAYRSCVLLCARPGDLPPELPSWDLRPLWAA